MSETGMVPLDAFAGDGAFRPDSRFVAAGRSAAEPSLPEPDPEDPLAAAWAEGFAAGTEQARAEAEQALAADRAAREGLALSFAALDAKLQEELRLRLRDTVAALCEEALRPLALDAEALMRRIDRAVSMLARADDERVICLHPEDLAMIGPQLDDEWHIRPDPALERGALRIESANGGVEDGPEQWRRAIAEALHQC